MIGASRIGFDPALPWIALYVLAGIVAIGWVFYLWRGGGAPILRALGFVLIFLGLMQPQIVRESREPAEDVALVVVDQSESLTLADRRDAARAAGDRIAQQLAEQPGVDVRVREARGGPDGTLIASVIEDALSDVSRDRIGGVIVVTDGQAADPPEDPRTFGPLGPVHLLVVGDPERGDRRLTLVSAPTFGIVGERMRIAARITDPNPNAQVRVRVTIDGQPAGETTTRANRDFEVDVRLPKRGANMIVLEADAGPQEITLANNRAAFAANGVRDRLRVLLVTGEPHPGARVWRNLLKSDPAVDLVHFTILRPPDKQDFTPLTELALIPFPTDELFDRQLGEFDLIIFDRYRRRGILQPYYFINVVNHIERGGALLVMAGDAETGYDGVYRTALASILPSQPTGTMTTRPYRPTVTALGARHPVVRGLPNPEGWGRWTRQIDARASGGQTVLSGADGRPLLVLDRAGRGRVAQLWSDQAWLWARGYDGGGPHGELLRRLAHWLMQEPELEDERLTLDANAQGLEIERSTLGAAPNDVELISPTGQRSNINVGEASPGVWRGRAEAPEQGLYEARSGNLRAFAAVGPLNPREAQALAATAEILRPITEASGGGVFMTGEDGRNLPDIRRVERGARAYGGDWLGIERNGAYTVRAAVASPLGAAWIWALIGTALLMLGWRRESA